MGLVIMVVLLFALFAFFMYDKAQAKYIKQLKFEINEKNIKLEKQKELFDNIYRNQ